MRCTHCTGDSRLDDFCYCQAVHQATKWVSTKGIQDSINGNSPSERPSSHRARSQHPSTFQALFCRYLCKKCNCVSSFLPLHWSHRMGSRTLAETVQLLPIEVTRHRRTCLRCSSLQTWSCNQQGRRPFRRHSRKRELLFNFSNTFIPYHAHTNQVVLYANLDSECLHSWLSSNHARATDGFYP